MRSASAVFCMVVRLCMGPWSNIERSDASSLSTTLHRVMFIWFPTGFSDQARLRSAAAFGAATGSGAKARDAAANLTIGRSLAMHKRSAAGL